MVLVDMNSTFGLCGGGSRDCTCTTLSHSIAGIIGQATGKSSSLDPVTLGNRDSIDPSTNENVGFLI